MLKTGDLKYLLKVFNGELSQNRDRCEEQCRLQNLWAENGIVVPKVVRDKNGHLQSPHLLPVANGEKMQCIGMIRIMTSKSKINSHAGGRSL